MYKQFFGMTRTPFARNLPVDELYMNGELNEVYERLKFAAENKAFLVLIGDSGAGKTTLLRRLKEEFHTTEYIVMYIAESNLTEKGLYRRMMDQLGCDCHVRRDDSPKDIVHRQIKVLSGVENKKVVVLIDEGHLLSRKTLEELRFLLNYDMDSSNPVSLIISGQTELWDMLRKQATRSVLQRVNINCFLMSYDLSQTKAFIEHHLKYAGHPSPIFSDDAIKLIYDYSAGVPRLICRVCTQSLMYAYQNRRAIIDDRMVQLVLETEVT